MSRSLLELVHRAAAPALRTAGFRWKEHLSPSTKIGVWTKCFRRAAGPRHLVVVPGFGDSSLSWLTYLTPLLPVIAQRYDRFSVLDFSGFHGFLSREPACASMDALVDVHHQALERLQPTALLGHSLGGWLAGLYAARCRSLEKLILLSPGGVIRREHELQDWRAKYERAREHGFSSYRPLLFHREPYAFKLIAGEFEKFFSCADINRFMNSIRRDHFVTDALAAITARIWLVWGDEDSLCPAHWAEDWARGATQTVSKSIIISPAGHAPHIEKPLVTALHLGQILLTD